MVSSGPSPLPSNVPLGRTRVAAIAAMLIVLAACVVQAVRADRACGRDFTYASDEAYMHLALARQMVTATQPSSGDDDWPVASALSQSASPAWTSLLAGVTRLTQSSGASDALPPQGRLPKLVPLVLNLAMAGLLILLVGHAIRLDVLTRTGMLIRLLLVGVVMPIPLLVLSGVEHMAHAFVLLLAVATSVEVIERERLAARRLLASMVWIALAVGLRYESLAAILGLLLWAWIRRRVGRMILPAVAGFGVVIGIAAFLGMHGQPWLPEPIRARFCAGSVAGCCWCGTMLARAVTNLRLATVPAALVLIAGSMLWSRREQQSSPDAEDRIRVGWLFVFLVAGVAHLLVGRVDETLRYPAYLVPIGLVAIARALANRPGAKWAPSAPVGLRYSVMAVFCLLPLAVAVVPVLKADWDAPEAARNVFWRNRQAASFLRILSSPVVVGANEVGALRYETRARVRALEAMQSESDRASKSEESRIALGIGRSLADRLEFKSWREVGGWRPVGGGEGVRVYVADDPRDARLALDIFARTLPAGLEIFRTGDGTATRPSEQ